MIATHKRFRVRPGFWVVLFLLLWGQVGCGAPGDVVRLSRESDEWALHGGTWIFNDSLGRMVVGASGRVYWMVVLESRTTVLGQGLSPVKKTGTEDDSLDILLVALNPDGTLRWHKVFASPQDERGVDLAVDAQENLYITGTYSGTLTLGKHTLQGSSISFPQAGQTLLHDAFVAKLDKDGTVLWATSTKSTSGTEGLRIAVNAAQQVFVTGIFAHTTTFGKLKLQAQGTLDSFLVRLDKDGNPEWARIIRSTKAQNVLLTGAPYILPSADGGVFLAGIFAEPLTLGSFVLSPQAAPDTKTPATDAFITKLSPTGQFEWAKQAGGLGSEAVSSIASDRQGGLYLVGTFSYRAAFGTHQLELLQSSVPGVTIRHNLYVTRLSPKGDFLWAKQGIGHFDLTSLQIASDAQGDAYISGSFQRAATFDKLSLSTPEGTYNRPMMLAKLAAKGEFLWAEKSSEEQIEGRAPYFRSTSLAIGPQGGIHLLGFFHYAFKFKHFDLSSPKSYGTLCLLKLKAR